MKGGKAMKAQNECKTQIVSQTFQPLQYEA
jgi:hypothetical protein